MRHHFIPAFYLRQWHGPDNKLVEYAIKRGKLLPKRASADATGFERDLYEYPELPSPLSQFRKHPARAVMGDGQTAAAEAWRCFQCQGSRSCNREAG
jgi:hypothetical protein